MKDLTRQICAHLFRTAFHAKASMSKAPTHASRNVLHGFIQGLTRATGIVAEELEGNLSDTTIAELEHLHHEVVTQEGRDHPIQARYAEQLPDEIGGLDLRGIKKQLDDLSS